MSNDECPLCHVPHRCEIDKSLIENLKFLKEEYPDIVANYYHTCHWCTKKWAYEI